MNESIRILTQKILSDLGKSTNGHLPLPSRKLIWHTLTLDKSSEDARALLTQLDIWCVEKGIKIWEKKFNDPQAIINILNVALAASNKTTTEASALSIRDEFYVAIVEDEDYEKSEYPAMFVGHAAANTVATAIDKFHYEPDDVRDDLDLDPDAFEPSFLIASAFAGGLSTDGDPVQRREFWEWYLRDAITQAASANNANP